MAIGDNGFSPQDRPEWVRLANERGRALAEQGVPVIALDPDSLHSLARERCGLDDFGADDYREPLEILCDALEREAELTPVGRWLTREELVNHLENRLRITDALKRHPEIADEVVTPPIFISGSGRSGTSILHEVMAEDPGMRALRHWEALYPAPPPTAETHARDPRITRADDEVKIWEAIAPRYKTMHEGTGSTPQECDFLFNPELFSDHIANAYETPSYARWVRSADFSKAFASHQLCLKILQWKVPTQQWLLKAPSHLSRFDRLFEAYPDSPVVVTHRDPLRVLASMTNLVTTLHWIRTDNVDPTRYAQRLVQGVGQLLLYTMRQRESGAFAGKKFIDVRYVDFVTDPVGTVERVYDELGRKLTPEAARRMGDYMKRKPRDRGHGTHRYTFADTGLDLEEQRELYRPYMEHYGIPEEEV